MPLGLLGLKMGMTQVYDKKGRLLPVTVLALGPCPVLQIRTPERDGYHAVQIGYQDKKRTKATRAERGHVAGDFSSKRRKALSEGGAQVLPKANCEPQRYIREFRLEGPPPEEIKVGTILTAAQLFLPKEKEKVKEEEKEKKKEEKGKKEEQEEETPVCVDVIGTSKGRGTTGVMKRHNFAGLPASHGAKKVHRQAGSTSSLASNRGSGRPKKGLRRAGRYGHSRVTVRNLEVVKVDAENHCLLVRGAVPGPNGGLVMVRPTNKKD